jgi:hypothetical protein
MIQLGIIEEKNKYKIRLVNNNDEREFTMITLTTIQQLLVDTVLPQKRVKNENCTTFNTNFLF